MAIKNITEVENKTNIVGDETLLGIDSNKNIIQMTPSNIPELAEAVGDETVIGVSNGKVVRIPVDSIGGSGSVEPIILRSKGTVINKGTTGDHFVYNDGTTIDCANLYAAFKLGIPIMVNVTSESATTIDDSNGLWRVVYASPKSIVFPTIDSSGALVWHQILFA